KAAYLAQLRVALRLRWLALVALVVVLAVTGVTAAQMGREFMPELEEGSMLIRGTFPVNVALEEMAERTRAVRRTLQQFPEASAYAAAVGRPDDGTDPTGYYNLELNCPLRRAEDWPVVPALGRPRTKAELVSAIRDALEIRFPGVDWDISQIIRDNVMEA